MGLFQPGWMNANENAADAAVRKLTDKAGLISAALKSPHKRVRMYAISRITDQKVLERIAVNDEEEGVRLHAVSGLTDQGSLARVALQNSMPFIRLLAVEKLTDQSALEQVERQERDEKVRVAAVSRLTNQELLKKIARGDKSKKARIAAIGQLTEEAELIRIVKNDTLRKPASKRLKELAAMKGQTLKDIVDQAGLINIITQSQDFWERQSAIMLLEDSELIRLIKEYPECREHRFALNQLADKEALKEIIQQSDYFDDKVNALGRLLEVADWDSVSIDGEVIQRMLEDPIVYSDCLKQIYRRTRQYKERIADKNGSHHDHGYRSDGCHEDSHFDLSKGIVFGFD